MLWRIRSRSFSKLRSKWVARVAMFLSVCDLICSLFPIIFAANLVMFGAGVVSNMLRLGYDKDGAIMAGLGDFEARNFAGSVRLNLGRSIFQKCLFHPLDAVFKVFLFSCPGCPRA